MFTLSGVQMSAILVVDDDPGVLKMMANVLSLTGHQARTAASGVEALKLLGIRPEDEAVELPDLILLDIMMPKCDGYTVAKLLRDNPRTRAIPILVVSALAELSKLFTATVQVEGFLNKPFAPDELLAAVSGVLRRRKPA